MNTERSTSMLLRAILIWLGILILASLNGAVRDLLVAPRFGDLMARAISTVILCVLIALVTWWSIGWIRPLTSRAALEIGIVWLVLTLTFEFGFGHFVSGKPWAELLADYDVQRGRIWVLVLIATLLAPLWAGWVRGIWAGASTK
jgi:hypothetical protein